MRDANRLTAVAVARKKNPGRYGDGLGLWLQVSPSGTKSWLFRYMRNGKARQMGLGAVHTVTLAEARETAGNCRKLLLAGLDPIEARRAERMQSRVEAARGTTFKDCGERYIIAHEAGWKNEKHRNQWKTTLATYAYPVLGELSVAAIDTALVLKVIEPIWTVKPETAARVRGRIEAVLDWATAREYRQGDNPARWRGHMDKLLPARSKVARVRHHAALPYDELPVFMAALRKQDGVSPRALEFAILTAARTGETVGARWAEIDADTNVWNVPAERMKGEREHRVPLSARPLEILESLPREGEAEFVFPGGRAENPLSNMALLGVLRRMGRGDVTTHGFRSTFRDWAAEQTAYPSDVCEAALAHALRDKTEAAYRRGDLFEKRRRLMADWSKYCTLPPPVGEKVVRLRSSGAKA
jgi:integrase